MYLERFEIENIKCFAQKTIFDFTQAGGAIKKWNVILGENGAGKSTLMQAIAIALAGPEATRSLLPRPDGWVRGSEPYGRISATLKTPEYALIGGDARQLAVLDQQPSVSRGQVYDYGRSTLQNPRWALPR
jgi:energy-coupling factor transporter ATP-binding protein EcfA2